MNFLKLKYAYVDYLTSRVGNVSTARVLMCILRQTSGFHRSCTNISIANMAKKTGLSKSAVIRSLKELEKDGLVSITRKNGKQSTINVIDDFSVLPNSPTGVMDDTTTGVMDDTTTGVMDDTTTGVTHATGQNDHQNIESAELSTINNEKVVILTSVTGDTTIKDKRSIDIFIKDRERKIGALPCEEKKIRATKKEKNRAVALLLDGGVSGYPGSILSYFVSIGDFESLLFANRVLEYFAAALSAGYEYTINKNFDSILKHKQFFISDEALGLKLKKIKGENNRDDKLHSSQKKSPLFYGR